MTWDPPQVLATRLVKTSLSRFLIITNGALLWTGGFTGAEHGANETLCVRVLV